MQQRLRSSAQTLTARAFLVLLILMTGVVFFSRLSNQGLMTPAGRSARVPFSQIDPSSHVRPVTLVDVPLSALTAGLQLTRSQNQQIAAMKQRDSPASSDGIKTVLTDTQNHALPFVLRMLTSLRASGIPLILSADLKLTPRQIKAVAALAPSGVEKKRRPEEDQVRERRDRVMAALNSAQQAQVQDALRDLQLLARSPLRSMDNLSLKTNF